MQGELQAAHPLAQDGVSSGQILLILAAPLRLDNQHWTFNTELPFVYAKDLLTRQVNNYVGASPRPGNGFEAFLS